MKGNKEIGTMRTVKRLEDIKVGETARLDPSIKFELVKEERRVKAPEKSSAASAAK